MAKGLLLLTGGACGSDVPLGSDDRDLTLAPTQVSFAHGGELPLTVRDESSAGSRRIQLDCGATGSESACPGYAANVWVDEEGVWLANAASDRRTLQLARFTRDGAFVNQATWREPDPLRTIKDIGLWRSRDDGALRAAIVEDGCDIATNQGGSYCLMSPERVRVLWLDEALVAQPQSLFALGSGYSQRGIATSRAGALLTSYVWFKQRVQGHIAAIMAHGVAADGELTYARTLRGDLSEPFRAIPTALNDAGRSVFVIDSVLGGVYGLDARGRRADDLALRDPLNRLESAVQNPNGTLEVVLMGTSGHVLGTVEGSKAHTKVLSIEGKIVLESAYFRRAQVSDGGGLDLCFAREPPGYLLCRIEPDRESGHCTELEDSGELWGIRSTAQDTWIATSSALIQVPHVSQKQAP